jgi:hypothetical protein
MVRKSALFAGLLFVFLAARAEAQSCNQARHRRCASIRSAGTSSDSTATKRCRTTTVPTRSWSAHARATTARRPDRASWPPTTRSAPSTRSSTSLTTPRSASPRSARPLRRLLLQRPDHTHNAAYFTTQGYTVTAASGALSAITPANRELYIEKLNSQNRNTVGGLFGPTSLQVGGIYTFNVLWSTAPGGYEQLEHFVNLTNTSFRLLSSYSVYDQPVAAVNTTIYADACGWDNNFLSGTYRSCIGPTNYPGGKTGGNVNTYFTVQILGATPVAGSQPEAR